MTNIFTNNKAFDFNITNYCNAICPTCKRYDGDFLSTRFNQEHMKFSEFKRIIFMNEELFSHKEVQFCGEFGDPLMHPEIEDFTKFACTIFSRLDINTNGAVNRKKYFEKVRWMSEKLKFYFGIDGLTHKTNKIYRGVNTELAFKNMFYCHENDHDVVWDFIVFQHNLDDVPGVVDLAIKNNIVLNIKINLRESFKDIKKINQEQFLQTKEFLSSVKTNLITFQDYYE